MEIPKLDLKNIDKKFIRMGIITIVVIFVIIIGLVVARIFITSKLSYSELENKMRDEAIEYYNNHEELLPKTSDGEVTLDIQKLIDDEKMKPFEKYLKDDEISCKGKVIVTVNDGNYLYTPYLDCGKKYKTVTLTETLINNDNIVDSGDGLYNMGDYYLYRGEKVNNYIEFAGQTWRILRVNNDGTIRILQADNLTFNGENEFVFDNRYNSEKDANVGFNDFNISRLKDTINSIYESDMFSKNDKSFMKAKPMCIGSRTVSESDNSGAVECRIQTQESYSIGLIQANEFLLASLDSKCHLYYDGECTNYNYLVNMTGSYWTSTPYVTDKAKTYKEFYIKSSLQQKDTNKVNGIRLVTNISSHALYASGNGTETNPYIMKYNKNDK